MIETFELLGHVVRNVPDGRPVLVVNLAIVPDLLQRDKKRPIIK
jgi:hypothetical protein